MAGKIELNKFKNSKELFGSLKKEDFSSNETAKITQCLTMLGSLSKWLHSEDTGNFLDEFTSILKVELSSEKPSDSFEIFQSVLTEDKDIDKSALKELLKEKLMRKVDRAFVWYFSNFLKKKYFEGTTNQNWSKEGKSKKLLGDLKNYLEGEGAEVFSHYSYLIAGQGSRVKFNAFKSSSVAGNFFESAMNLKRDLFGTKDQNGVNVYIPTNEEIMSLFRQEAEKNPDVQKALNSLQSKASAFIQAFKDAKENPDNFTKAFWDLYNLLNLCRNVKNEALEELKKYDFNKYGLGDFFLTEKGLEKIWGLKSEDYHDFFESLKNSFIKPKEETQPNKKQGKEDGSTEGNGLAPDSNYDPLTDTSLSPEERKQALIQAYMKGEVTGREFARIDAAIQNSTPMYAPQPFLTGQPANPWTVVPNQFPSAVPNYNPIYGGV